MASHRVFGAYSNAKPALSRVFLFSLPGALPTLAPCCRFWLSLTDLARKASGRERLVEIVSLEVLQNRSVRKAVAVRTLRSGDQRVTRPVSLRKRLRSFESLLRDVPYSAGTPGNKTELYTL